MNASVERQELQVTLREITDMERSIGRIVAGTANARDLLGMATAMSALPELLSQLSAFRVGAAEGIGGSAGSLGGPLQRAQPRHCGRAAVYRSRGRHDPGRL